MLEEFPFMYGPAEDQVFSSTEYYMSPTTHRRAMSPMSMAMLSASGLLFPGAGALVTRTASCPLRPTAAPSHVRLPAATAPARARLRSAARPAVRVRPRCAPSGGRTDGVADEDDVAGLGLGLPWWAPSIEELMEFDKTDFSSEAIKERFVRESKEATAAVKGAAAGLLLRPLRDLFDDVRKLKTVYDVEEFHIGLPVGALMACVAVYHLWKAAPSACVDFALHYAFYRLCVIAADIRRRGFATDMIIRLKLFVIIAMLIKGCNKTFFFLGYVRFALFVMYFFSVGFEVRGLKKYGRYILPCIFDSTAQEWLDTLSEIEQIDEDDQR